MFMNDNSQGTLITTIHNLESVVEVYINQNHDKVTEFKQLSGNRTKRYEYEIEEYISMNKNFKNIDVNIKKFLAENLVNPFD